MGISRNTFTKGKNSDIEETFQPQGTYRRAYNKRLIQRDDGSYSINSTNGTQIFFKLPHDDWFIVGTVSDGDNRLYILSSDSKTTTVGAGEIGYVTISNINNKSWYEAEYTPLYHHVDLNFSAYYPASRNQIKYQEETELVKRIYWTDNFNKPRVINVANSIFSQQIGASSLVVGEEYMVISGVASHNSQGYGPGQANGTVFTAVGATWTGTATVIEYFNIDSLDWQFDVDKPLMYPSGVIDGGSLACGNYSAMFSIVNQDGGQSPWSIATSTMSVTSHSQSGTTLNVYQDYQGETPQSQANKSVKYTIENIPSSASSIKIVLIKYIDEGLFEEPRIMIDEPVISTTQEFTINGSYTLETLTAEEISEILAVFKNVATIETFKNRMFAGGNTYVEGLEDWNPGQVSISSFLYEGPSDDVGHTLHGQNGNPMAGHIPSPGDTATGNLVYGQLYVVEADANEYATYGGTQYGPNEAAGIYFRANSTDGKAYTESHASVDVTPCIRIKKYKGSGTDYYRHIKIVDDFLDYKGSLMQGNLRGYRRGQEKYRFGILFWSKQMTPLFVHTLGDYVTSFVHPDNQLINHYSIDSDESNDFCTMNYMGIRIGSASNPLDLNDIPDIEDKISGFSIVRLPHIRKNIAQGLITYYAKRAANLSHVSAWAAPVPGVNYDVDQGEGYPEAMGFWSPEYNFNDPSINDQDTDLEGHIVQFYRDSNLTDTQSGSSSSYNSDGNMNEMNNTSGGNWGRESWFLKYNQYYTTTPSSPALPQNSFFPVEKLVKVLGTEAESTKYTGVLPLVAETIINDTSNINSQREGRSGVHMLLVPGIGRWTYIAPQCASDTSGDSWAWYKATVDIYNPVNDNVDYGDAENGEYMTCGHFQPINANVIAETNLLFEDIEVWGGDTFVNYWDFGYTLPNKNVTDKYGVSISVPVETYINTHMRVGRHPMSDGFFGDSGNAGGLASTHPESNALFDAYNQEAYAIKHQHLPAGYVASNSRLNTLIFSDAKITGEAIDSFRRFPGTNERYTDISIGNIKALKRFKEMLFSFQENGVLYLPIEEAQVINSDIGSQVLIGIGGVIDRYTNRSEHLGLQDTGHLIATETGIFWCDVLRNKICFLSAQNSIKEISTVKGIQNDLETYLRASDIQSDIGDFASIAGIGIETGYDERYGQIIFTFISANKGDWTFAVDENTGMFLGDYGFYPYRYLEHNGLLMSTPRIHGLNNYGLVNGSFTAGLGLMVEYKVGDKVMFRLSTGESNIYMCITDYTSTNAETDPGDLDEFVLLGEVGSMYLFDYPQYDNPANYYGEPQEESVQFVINEKNHSYKRYKAFRIQGNSTNHDYMTCETPEHNSGEIDLLDYSTYRMGSWDGKFPLNASDEQRMRGFYMAVTLRHDRFIRKGNATLGSGDTDAPETVEAEKAAQGDLRPIKLISFMSTFNESKKYGI